MQTMRFGEWFQILIPKKWEGKSIEELFRQEWEIPKKLTHAFRMEKSVQVNGNDVNWTTSLSAGEKLQIRAFNEEDIQFPPHYREMEVLYEDDHLMVVNKPPFLKTHPNDANMETDTLLNMAQYHMLANGELRNIRQIHRLDRDTSGAIVFGKHALAGAILDNMLAKREMKRTYAAMVEGILRKKSGIINEPIGRDRHHPTKRRVSPSGQSAVTHYQVLAEDKRRNFSYIKAWLETGRTHQIRVHLSHLGHPLAGDPLYGGKPIITRQALHAGKLEFPHPFTGENIRVFAPFTDNPVIFKHIDVYSL
ncbi:RluA family pseudouridine synthase [Neobacillus mesonae]|uniref:RluA family pseudouridine synthase n=1 Tax=Neobacillus mesonae TaxID=1193713 RepID=UPI00203ED2AB|nr:RluA family pseudouridine synthase [Neobacillus mesonae]MCM3567962.1 RluA family pseudouridine synthase [Neobacillus mesonae]